VIRTGKMMFAAADEEMASAEACATRKSGELLDHRIGDRTRGVELRGRQDVSTCQQMLSSWAKTLQKDLFFFFFGGQGREDLIGEYQRQDGPELPGRHGPGFAGRKRSTKCRKSRDVRNWGFRMMIGFGAASAGIGLIARG